MLKQKLNDVQREVGRGLNLDMLNLKKKIFSGELHIRDTGKSDENSGLEMSNESFLTHEWESMILILWLTKYRP